MLVQLFTGSLVHWYNAFYLKRAIGSNYFVAPGFNPVEITERGMSTIGTIHLYGPSRRLSTNS